MSKALFSLVRKILDKRKGTAYVIITYFQIETFVKTGVRIIYIFGTCICYMYMLQVRFKLRNFFQPRSYFNLGYFAILKRAIIIFGVWLKNRGLVFGGFSKRIGCIFKEIKRLVSFPFLHYNPPPPLFPPPPPSFKQGKESKKSLFVSNDFYDQAKTWLGQEGGTF